MSSIYKRGDWYWYKTHIDGKSVRLPLGVRDRTEANLLKAKKDIEYAQAPSIDSDCAKAIKKYMEALRARRVTEEYAKATERRLLAICSGHFYLREITEAVISGHVAQCKSKYDANNSLSAVKAFMKWCVGAGYVFKDPSSAVKKLTIQERARRSFTPAELKRIIFHAKKEDIYPLIMIALYAGLRKSELFRLDWQDIDFKRGVILVRVSKSKKIRRVPISLKLRSILEYRKRDLGPICASNVWQQRSQIERIFRRAKVDGGWHHFRHTFCTVALQAGADVQTVCDLAGHSSISVTAKYLTSTPAHHADAVNRLNFSTRAHARHKKEAARFLKRLLRR